MHLQQIRTFTTLIFMVLFFSPVVKAAPLQQVKTASKNSRTSYPAKSSSTSKKQHPQKHKNISKAKKAKVKKLSIRTRRKPWLAIGGNLGGGITLGEAVLDYEGTEVISKTGFLPAFTALSAVFRFLFKEERLALELSFSINELLYSPIISAVTRSLSIRVLPGASFVLFLNRGTWRFGIAAGVDLGISKLGALVQGIIKPNVRLILEWRRPRVGYQLALKPFIDYSPGQMGNLGMRQQLYGLSLEISVFDYEALL